MHFDFMGHRTNAWKQSTSGIIVLFHTRSDRGIMGSSVDALVAILQNNIVIRVVNPYNVQPYEIGGHER